MNQDWKRLIALTDDTGVKEALGFLMTREIAHQKSFEKALYAIEPNFPPGKLPGDAGKREAIKFATADIVIALFFAFLVNAAILIVSSAVFHERGQTQVAEIQDAHRLLSPMLGSTIASTLFALALLASGQSSTITATMAGQIVMEGFLHWRMKPWARRLVTRTASLVAFLIITLNLVMLFNLARSLLER